MRKQRFEKVLVEGKDLIEFHVIDQRQLQAFEWRLLLQQGGEAVRQLRVEGAPPGIYAKRLHREAGLQGRQRGLDAHGVAAVNDDAGDGGIRGQFPAQGLHFLGGDLFVDNEFGATVQLFFAKAFGAVVIDIFAAVLVAFRLRLHGGLRFRMKCGRGVRRAEDQAHLSEHLYGLIEPVAEAFNCNAEVGRLRRVGGRRYAGPGTQRVGWGRRRTAVHLRRCGRCVGVYR